MNQMIDKQVLKASFTSLTFHPSVCPLVSPYMSHVQYTQRHSPDASLPGRACSFWYHRVRPNVLLPREVTSGADRNKDAGRKWHRSY